MPVCVRDAEHTGILLKLAPDSFQESVISVSVGPRRVLEQTMWSMLKLGENLRTYASLEGLCDGWMPWGH